MVGCTCRSDPHLLSSSKLSLSDCDLCSLQMHVVTYNTKFSNIGDAIGSGEHNALAVVGTLFHVSYNEVKNKAFL